jgi:hypothetical protein
MKHAMVALSAAFLLFSSVAFAGYSYFDSENLYTPNWSDWYQNGTFAPYWYSPGGYGGLGQGSGGSMISRNEPYGGEVRLTIRVDPSYPDAAFMAYLGSDTGTASNLYSLEVYTAGQLNLTKLVSGSYTSLAVVTVSNIADGSTLRAILHPVSSTSNIIIVYINNSLALWFNDTTNLVPLAGSAPGFGIGEALGGTLLSEVDLGNLDTTPPNAIPASSIGVSAQTNQVSLQWPAATDDPNGVGVYGYQISRNGQVLTTTTALSYTDATVVPNSNYTYTLTVVDYHWNT